MITSLRAQGHGQIVPIIQDLNKFTIAKGNEIKKTYKRFFESEFIDTKTISLNTESDILKLLLEFQRINTAPTLMQHERGYMLVEGINFKESDEYIDIWGVAKGKGFSPYEHVHLTGFGDLEVLGVAAALNRDSLTMAENGAFLSSGMDEEVLPSKVTPAYLASFWNYRSTDGKAEDFDLFSGKEVSETQFTSAKSGILDDQEVQSYLTAASQTRQ